MAFDSTAAFANRITELGLARHVDRFVAAKWTTFGKLAFATEYIPGPGADENKFKEDIARKGLGDPNHDDAPLLKRLFFEAFTLGAEDLARRTCGTVDDVPRKIPLPEKEACRARTAQMLPHLRLVDELDVSDRLLDLCFDMREGDKIGYLGIELCTKRNMEVLGAKKQPQYAPTHDAAGFLRYQRIEECETTALDNQLQISFAFQRRSLALEMTDIMSYANAELLKDRLIAAVMKPSPTGYAAVSLQQALEADQVAWQLLSEKTRGGIKRLGNSARPCDLALPLILVSHAFDRATAPRQIAVGSARTAAAFTEPLYQPSPNPQLTQNQRKKAAKRERELAAAALPPPAVNPDKRHKGKGKGGDKGGKGGKGGDKGTRMPADLQGMCAMHKGERLCFGFNLGTCSSAQPGGKCFRGLHVCCKPKQNGEACGGSHTKNQCTVC